MKDLKRVYVCGTCWTHFWEKVYGSINSLKDNCSCWEKCGIAELEVRLGSWVKVANPKKMIDKSRRTKARVKGKGK